MMRPGDSELNGGLEPGEQLDVELFGEIIAELIGGVNAALNGSELRVGDAGGAGFVFDVPEIEVGSVVLGNGLEPGGQAVGWIFSVWIGRLLMPGAGLLVVQVDDGGGGEHWWSSL